MDELMVIALIAAAALVFYLLYTLWKTFQEVDSLTSRIEDLNEDLRLADNRNNTLDAVNKSLRQQIAKHNEEVHAPLVIEAEHRPLSDFVDEIEPTEEEEVQGTVIDEVVTPNPQHFRPMFDSQGPLFNTDEPAVAVEPEKRDYMFFPEDYTQEVVGEASAENTTALYEEDTVGDTGESAGPESVQDGEETTNGVLRSGTVSGV